MAALCGMLVVIFPMVQEEAAILTGIFFTGFALYGINGILWLYALDQGGGCLRAVLPASSTDSRIWGPFWRIFFSVQL